MNCTTARRSVAVVGLVALLALTLVSTPAAAGGFASGASWDVFARAWAWLVDLGGFTHLRGEAGSFIDPDGRTLQVPPANGHGMVHLRGEAGGYIDPNGAPLSAAPGNGHQGGYIDPDGTH